MATTMEGRDAISGSLAECYVDFGNETYNMMNMTKFESKWTPNITEVSILGKVGKAHKPAGATGTFTGTAHFNTSVIRKLMHEYHKTGYMPACRIRVVNEDPTSAAGSQTIIHTGCYFSDTTLAKFDTASDYLEEDVSGTFDDWDMPEEFTPLNGMKL